MRRSPFTLAVEPVETRSTIASASPSRGAASTEPEIVTSSAVDAERLEAAPRRGRVRRRHAEALRSASAAAARRSAPPPRACSGRSRARRAWTTSASLSTTRFAPVIPRRRRRPARTRGCRAAGRAAGRRARSRRGRAARARWPRSAGRGGAESSVGCSIRPFEGTATVSRPFSPARSTASGHLALPTPGGALERQLVAAGPVAQPVGHSGDRSRARVHGVGDVEVGTSVVDQPRDLPTVGERLELAERAQVAKESPRLVAVAQDEQRVGEFVEAGDLLDGMFGLRLFARLPLLSC